MLESTTVILAQTATTSRLSDDTAYIPMPKVRGFTPFLVSQLPVCSRLQLLWADSGYHGEPFAHWVQQECGWRVQVVSKDPQQHGFAVLPKRWIVERTFSWLNKWRRLSKDYEQNPQSSRACIQLAMIKLMLNRL